MAALGAFSVISYLLVIIAASIVYFIVPGVVLLVERKKDVRLGRKTSASALTAGVILICISAVFAVTVSVAGVLYGVRAFNGVENGIEHYFDDDDYDYNPDYDYDYDTDDNSDYGNDYDSFDDEQTGISAKVYPEKIVIEDRTYKLFDNESIFYKGYDETAVANVEYIDSGVDGETFNYHIGQVLYRVDGTVFHMVTDRTYAFCLESDYDEAVEYYNDKSNFSLTVFVEDYAWDREGGSEGSFNDVEDVDDVVISDEVYDEIVALSKDKKAKAIKVVETDTAVFDKNITCGRESKDGCFMRDGINIVVYDNGLYVISDCSIYDDIEITYTLVAIPDSLADVLNKSLTDAGIVM